MKPFVLPASTATMFGATCFTTILVWVLKVWMSIEVPNEVAAAMTGLTTLVVGHLTTDSPPATVAREAVSDAADKVDAAEAKRKGP